MELKIFVLNQIPTFRFQVHHTKLLFQLAALSQILALVGTPPYQVLVVVEEDLITGNYQFN